MTSGFNTYPSHRPELLTWKVPSDVGRQGIHHQYVTGRTIVPSNLPKTRSTGTYLPKVSTKSYVMPH